MKASKPKRVQKYSPRVETRLVQSDLKRLNELAAIAGKTRADFVREILRWYLNNHENLILDQRESAVAQAIKHQTDQHLKDSQTNTDRICRILDRQSVALGTLYELNYLALSGSPEAIEAFCDAVDKAKKKVRVYAEQDKAELDKALKTVSKPKISNDEI